MIPMILRINSGNVRKAPHEGVLCTEIRVPVIATNETKNHNGNILIKIIDQQGHEHWVDPFFLEE